MALMKDEEAVAVAVAPLGEVSTDHMPNGSHLDSSCRRKDPGVHISRAVPER